MSNTFLPSEYPIVAAPMAGGATTVELAAAAGAAGAFPFLAAGYKTPDALHDEIFALRTGTSDFGVNLFVPGRPRVNRESFAGYARAITDEFRAYGLNPNPDPVDDDDAWGEKLALLREDPVAVVSLTFGLPPASEIALLKRAGSIVMATVTSPAEAREAEAAGVDALVVQGPGAGGHSATWDPDRRIADGSTADSLGAAAAASRLPLVAAGGVEAAADVQDLLANGAEAVAVGTLLLLTDEAGTSETHRRALASGEFDETVVTRVFTGRPARALRNGFVERHAHEEITAYPAVHHLTRELRKRAGAAGDQDRLHLWAGTGYRKARTEPVAQAIARLAEGL
ncbi:nitronate monooxygenase [Leucobacter sp. NPDC015123]|uniref:nitronate monooxygenase n=1 Tax=Leucobacter sp. NPDC015123 TaxID=3364129 RepID=UPI0036F4601F